MFAIVTVLFLAIGLFFTAVYKNDDLIGYSMIAAVALAIVAFVARRYLRPYVILATRELVKIDVPSQEILRIDMSGSSSLVGLGLVNRKRDL